MNKAIWFLCIATLTTSVAYGDDQELLRTKLAEKLAQPFVKFGKWETDYTAAKQRAKKEGKLLFVYFTRTFSA